MLVSFCQLTIANFQGFLMTDLPTLQGDNLKFSAKKPIKTWKFCGKPKDFSELCLPYL